ncbi:hypothetical protein CFIMG_007043RA [Ceratocystis fimbriata CBS 114723]|uniref:Myb-like domain-containing protein n=1 Tax=Ceratocystis fimbriata CBS 114723 TaxID=1035309 RepID=A0A2C5WRR5_9PEZI|nr:hypothetical protein CFIMG_007043RA [Ceratocystis fimbriata CBS 114723]
MSSTHFNEQTSNAGRLWIPSAETDLLFAILYAKGKPALSWEPIENIMSQLGYTFTRSALRSHFNNKMIKEFQLRCDKHGIEFQLSPNKTVGSRRKRTPRTADDSAYYPEDSDETDVDMVMETPSKRKRHDNFLDLSG